MLTVNDLISARTNEVSTLAGHAGGDRLVTWAHVCDLPDPWTWVRPGDLVMTTGDGLPAAAEEQASWLSAVIDVGISALILAPRPGAPQASAAMREVADERSVPLLHADFSLEFSGLARTVIESAVQSERDHINTARRLFDVYSEALRSRGDLSGRLDVVARSLGWAITVTRSADGSVVAAGGRHEGDDAGSTTVPVPGRVPVDVHVRPDQRRLLDGSLVHYLAGLVGIELEHKAQAHQQRQRQGEIVLLGALDGSINGAQLRRELAAHGMGEGPVVLTVLRGAAAHSTMPELQDSLLDSGVEPLLASVGDDLVAVMPDGWTSLDRYRLGLAPSAATGVSAPLALGADLRESLLQARTAAACAADAGEPVVFYAELPDLGALGPRWVSETRQLVTRLLDPLIEHDRSAGSDLLTSLDLFLRHDRSWVRTAEALRVHRQTLVYRLGQVERLAGHKPTSSSGIAAFWTALEAGRAIGLVPPIETSDH